MTILWAIVVLIVIVVVLLICLLLTHVRMSIHVRQVDADTDGLIEMKGLFGLVHVKRKIYGIKTKFGPEGPQVKTAHGSTGAGREETIITAEEVLHIIANWPRWLAFVREVGETVKALLRHVDVTKLKVAATVGTGDIVSTGVAYGIIWSAVAGVFGRLSYLAHYRSSPDIHVQANFDKAVFQADLTCILRVRLGYAILAVLRIVRLWRRNKSNGTSHPRTHEDSDGEHTRDGRRQHDYRRSG